MNSSDNNHVIVTRNLEWSYDKANLNNDWTFSETFDIFFENDKTTWKLILDRCIQGLYYAQLKKIKSTSDDFIVDLEITPKPSMNIIKTILHPQFLDTWIRIGNIQQTISIKMSLIRNKPDIIDCICPTKSILSNYEKLFNTDKLSDFKFICSDGTVIPAHRCFLIAHSPVMYKMLMAPMIESKTHQVNLNDIDGKTMLEVLRFLYTGKVEDVKTLAPNLLYCAEKYEMTELKNFAAASMANNLTIDNVLEYFMLADRYDENYLLGKCIVFMKNNHEELKTREDWNYSDSKLKMLLKYFVTDDYKNAVHVLKTHSSFSLPN